MASSKAGDYEKYMVKNIRRSITGSIPTFEAGYWENVRCKVA